jgi:hypothetical protein
VTNVDAAGTWAGFAVGLCLLALTWSSVVKMLLVPGNTRSFIARVAARGVLTGFRLGASRIAGMERRERALAAGPPVFLVGLLGCWMACLYVAYAGSRGRLGAVAAMPQRPVNREPGSS